ncbi:MAG TPA: acetate/propionate family kinase [Hyphomicrobiales bacterium]|nr:acetate/propionate family kinase [Hyphomicrobiales bacterium]
MTELILVLNAGSSTLKFALHDARSDGPAVLRGVIDLFNDAPVMHLGGEDIQIPSQVASDKGELFRWLIDFLPSRVDGAEIMAGAHRVVHGGRAFTGAVRITPDVLAKIRDLAPLAPAHQPANIAGIEALEAARPGLPQIACFDTAFHRSQPRIAQLYALPRSLIDDGVLRYGFHGLSYEYIAGALPDGLRGNPQARIIALHLGHGASVCAMRGGRSVATSMGFTALDGLVMGKRCGDLDPGVVLHLIRDRGMSVGEAETLLAEQSGLLGVSGISHDMRELLASDDPHAREAVGLFVYRACAQIGAMAAALGGVDTIVFAGGIGEHAAPVRKEICEGCAWLGLMLDESANERGEERISALDSKMQALIIRTDEEAVIAHHARQLL